MAATVDVLDVELVVNKPPSTATVDVLDIELVTTATPAGGTATVDILEVSLELNEAPVVPIGNPNVDVIEAAIEFLPGGLPQQTTGIYMAVGGVLVPVVVTMPGT